MTRDNRLVHIADLAFAQYNNHGKKTQWEAMLDALEMAYELGGKDALKKAARWESILSARSEHTEEDRALALEIAEKLRG